MSVLTLSTRLELQQKMEIEALELALKQAEEDRDYFSRLCDIKDESFIRILGESSLEAYKIGGCF